eukprot:jgi/Psemu1/18137/gm1.18137_g
MARLTRGQPAARGRSAAARTTPPEDVQEAVTRATATGGIPGYAGERALTKNTEIVFREILQSFGLNRATADGLF